MFAALEPFLRVHGFTLGGENPKEDCLTPFIQVGLTSYTTCYNSVTASDSVYALLSWGCQRDDHGTTRSLFRCFFIVWPVIDASNVYQYHMRDVESQRAGRYISSGVEGIVRHDL